MTLSVKTLCNLNIFPAFCGTNHHFKGSNKQVVDTSVVTVTKLCACMLFGPSRANVNSLTFFDVVLHKVPNFQIFFIVMKFRIY